MKKLNLIKDDTRKILNKSDRANILIDRASAIELKGFIIDAISYNEKLIDYLITYFLCHDNNESLKEYENQVKSLKKMHFSTSRYLEDYKVKAFSKDIQLMVNIAERHIENKNYLSGFFIAAAILKVVISIFNDHKYASLKKCVDSPMELIHDISQFDISEDIRKQILDFCLKSLKSNIFINWDWQNDIFELAIELCKNQKENKALMDSIDNNIKDLKVSQLAQTYKYKAILHFLGNDEAYQYFEENIKNPLIRKIIIEEAIENNEIENALKILNLGLDYDKDDRRFMTLWHEYLYEIFQANNDMENSLYSACFLLMNSEKKQDEYYKYLKLNIKYENWDPFFESIISSLEETENSSIIEFIATLFVWEKRWNRLVDFLNNQIYYYRFEFLEKLFFNNKTEEIAEVYEKIIFHYLFINNGVDYYNTGYKGIRDLIESGYTNKASSLIRNLKQQFPRKISLHEKLKELEFLIMSKTNSL